MAIEDIAGQTAVLAACYGPLKSSAIPDALEIALFTKRPSRGGVELDLAGGYAPIPTDAGADWDAADGQAFNTVELALADYSSAGWTAGGEPATARWWQLRDPDTGVFYDGARLAEPLNVDAAGIRPFFPINALIVETE